MMCTLDRFSPLPEDNTIPICDIDGYVRYSSVNEVEINLAALIPSVSSLPKVDFSLGTIRATSDLPLTRNISNVFISPHTNQHAIRSTWYRNGIWAAISTVLGFQFDNTILRSCTQLFKRLIFRIFSRGNQIGNDLSFEGIETTDWKSSIIRIIRWHPQLTKFAMVTRDDGVYIYTAGFSIPSVVKHRLQNHVTSVAFRPYNDSILAAGCAEGVYLWDINQNSVITAPPLSYATLLSTPEHMYIASISFNDSGDLLVSCSLCCCSIYVWNIDFKEPLVLTRYGGGNPTLVSWSPDMSYIFSNTKSVVFRIWNVTGWGNEKWFVPSGCVKTICWSPSGSQLLYSISGDCYIYSLNIRSQSVFVNSKTNNPKAVRVADLTRVELPCGNIIGGEVADMVWDPRGKFLAVMFKSIDLIAVFYTVISPQTIQVTPWCIIKGKPNEMPLAISFQSNYRNGSNLLIAWSSGRLQYFPFYESNLGRSISRNNPRNGLIARKIII